MKTRPILFRPELVTKIRRGEKTQTRRIVRQAMPARQFQSSAVLGMFRCPYGAVGEFLWVRETWAQLDGEIIFRADRPGKRAPFGLPWKPSIFMPRGICRLELQIRAISVQRLEDISEDDARAEGVDHKNRAGIDVDIGGEVWNGAYREAFLEGFRKMNAKRMQGEDNPWLWVIDFTPIKVRP